LAAGGYAKPAPSPEPVAGALSVGSGSPERPGALVADALGIIRGLLFCPTDACRARAFRHRDDDACRLTLDNALSVDAGRGQLPCMAHVRFDEAPAGRFALWAP
jgi:hypothetical protein